MACLACETRVSKSLDNRAEKHSVFPAPLSMVRIRWTGSLTPLRHTGDIHPFIICYSHARQTQLLQLFCFVTTTRSSSHLVRGSKPSFLPQLVPAGNVPRVHRHLHGLPQHRPRRIRNIRHRYNLWKHREALLLVFYSQLFFCFEYKLCRKFPFPET